MKTAWAALLVFLTMLAGGCESEPFHRVPLPLLKNPDPQAMLESFKSTVPNRRVTFDDTVIIEAPFRDKLVVLGELVVDRQADTFDLVGLTPLGVTLFQLSGDSHGTTIRSAIPPLMQHKEMLISIGQDIRRIYFDLIPSAAARTHIGATEIEFREKTPEGMLVYEFGGEPCVLLEKRLDGFFGVRWRIRYYEYIASNGNLFSQGIVLDNHQFHYRIIVKNRTVE